MPHPVPCSCRQCLSFIGNLQGREHRHYTLVDKSHCLGCRACLWACPFGVPTYDEEGKLELCDLCIDRLRQGKKTACEAACQARAIFVGSPKEIRELRAKTVVKRMAEGGKEVAFG